MAFRSDLEAAHARAQALEGKVAALEAENAELRGESEPEPYDADLESHKFQTSMTKAIVVVALVGMSAAFALYQAAILPAALAVAIMSVSMMVAMGVMRSLVHICPPGFAIVLSGQDHPGPDGSKVGYRIVTSGRVVRMPILEVADLLDCRLRTIECHVANAYSKDATPLHVAVSASYRISTFHPTLHNAVARFLGRDITEVDRVARETMEGHLRGVIAVLTLAELQTDQANAAQLIIQEAEVDFEKLGMDIDSLALTKIAGPELS